MSIRHAVNVNISFLATRRVGVAPWLLWAYSCYMSNYNVTASRFSLPVGDSMPLKGVAMSVLSSAYDCEFCLNNGDQGDEGNGCFCCGLLSLPGGDVLSPVSMLEIGDVVWANGMRIELLTKDSDEGRYGADPELPVYWFAGKVLNVEEVNEAGVVPFSWRCETRPQFEGTVRYSDKGDRWQVQSNDLHKWRREARAN